MWTAIAAHQERFSAMGKFSDTRSLLALGRLSHGTWNTYASSLQPFLRFLSEHGVPLQDVTDSTLEQYVCWVLEQPKLRWTGGTLASRISAVRTCWDELGMPLSSHHGPTKGALAGYRRLMESTLPVKLARQPWTASNSHACLLAALPLMVAFAGGTLPLADVKLVVAAAHVVLASLTFSRGDTTNPMEMADLTVAPDRFLVSLLKQKRPAARLPEQVHGVTAAPADPSGFLVQFHGAQVQRGFTPTSLLFGIHPAAAAAFSLDASVKLWQQRLAIPQSPTNPLTGHCVRVGAVSEAFAVGVPLLTCSFMCGHKSTSPTAGYVRHGHVPSAAAGTYYRHLLTGADGRLSL